MLSSVLHSERARASIVHGTSWRNRGEASPVPPRPPFVVTTPGHAHFSSFDRLLLVRQE